MLAYCKYRYDYGQWTSYKYILRHIHIHIYIEIYIHIHIHIHI